MNASIETIKQLRAESGAGVMECRKALEQANQDYAQARAALRERAEQKAAQRSRQEATEGTLALYGHNRGRIGVMVEINTETEFASRSEVFRRLADEIALQIAAAAPLYVRDEDIPAEALEEQRRAALERAAGKPEKAAEQIVNGALEKFKDAAVLLRQAYIRDESRSVAQLVSQAAGQTGENIVIRRFVRWEIRPDEAG